MSAAIPSTSRPWMASRSSAAIPVTDSRGSTTYSRLIVSAGPLMRRRDAQARVHEWGVDEADRKSASSDRITSARESSSRGSTTRPNASRAPSQAARRDTAASKCTTTSPRARRRCTRSTRCGALVGCSSTCVRWPGAGAAAMAEAKAVHGTGSPRWEIERARAGS